MDRRFTVVVDYNTDTNVKSTDAVPARRVFLRRFVGFVLPAVTHAQFEVPPPQAITHSSFRDELPGAAPGETFNGAAAIGQVDVVYTAPPQVVGWLFP